MKFSMGAWSFAFGPYAADPKPLDEIAQRLAKAGYDGIELSGFPPHVTPEKYNTPAARSELRRSLADLGLGISGYSADLGAINPTTAENHTAYVDHFKQLLELCAEIGSPMIRFDTGTAPGSISDTDYLSAFYRLADVWRECADHARHAGVLMAWEFEPGFIFNNPAEVVSLHQRVGHPWFQILFDTAHAYMSAVVGARQHGKRQVLEGGVTEFLTLLHGSIGAIHVIDSDGTLYMDETSTHIPLGQGLILWETLAPKLRAVSNVDWWCADLCFFPNAWELVDDNLRAARAMHAKAASAI